MSDRKTRIAHVLHTDDPTGKPIITDKNSRLPLALRQHAVEKFFEFYSANTTKPEAIQEALIVEKKLYDGCKKKCIYKNRFLYYLNSLKQGKSLESRDELKSKIALLSYDEVVNRLNDLLITAEFREQMNFPCSQKSFRVEPLEGQEIDCSRCSRSFLPEIYYALDDPEPCNFHYGRLQSVKNVPHRIYSCCNSGAAEIPCTTAPKHVFLRKTFLKTDRIFSSDDFPLKESQLNLVALDGEMCHTEKGLELCRLTMSDWDENRVLDVLIRPDNLIVDYNTRFSGITEETYETFNHVVPAGFDPRAYKFCELIQEILPCLIGPETIIVGHSLENDFYHLKLDHKKIIDTSQLYPHSKGPPYRMALRDLTRIHLKQFVQEGSSGHDSYEDCVACLRLLKLKL